MTEDGRTVFHDLNGSPDEPDEVVVDLQTGLTAEAPTVEVEKTDETTTIVQEVVEAAPDPEAVEKPKHDSFEARLQREQRAKTRQRERADAAERTLAEERQARAQEREQVNARLAALEKTAPPVTAEFDQKLNDAQERLTTAIADGNSSEQAKITRELSQLELDRRVAAATARQPAPKVEIKPEPKTRTVNPKAEQWKARNTWFGKPEFQVQTDAAIAAAGLLEHQEGWDPSDEDFYAEVDARLAKSVRIPKARPNGSTVASTQGRQDPPGNTVRLTRGDQEIMRTLKLDPENPAHLKRYALEKRAAQNA